MSLPALPNSFSWTHESWGPALRCRPLAAIAPHFFTTRGLDLRAGGAQRNGWTAIAQAIGVPENAVVRLKQVHGRDAVVIRRGDGARALHGAPEADVLVSDDEYSAIAVQAADCVPLLMADPTTGVVAAVHAGWRGTAAGAGPTAVEVLQRDFGVRPADLVVAIGPSIGACCYEVGSELIDAFARAGHGRALIEHWFVLGSPASAGGAAPRPRLDLWAANRDQLVMAGVRDENVHGCELCTASNLDVLCSYRAEGAGTGRLAGVIRAGAHERRAG